MKRKFFWTTFITLLLFIASVFIVDRIYFYNLIESNSQSELETIASSIMASDLSLEVLNKFETTDDIIRELIDNQRIDRTIRIFTPLGELTFSNNLGQELPADISPDTWSKVDVRGQKLKRLTIKTDQYILEVGMFLDTQIIKTQKYLFQILSILGFIVILSSFIAFFITKLTMKPLNQLGQFFVEYNQKNYLKKSQDHMTDSDLMTLHLLSKSKDEVSILAKSLISFLNKIRTEQAKKSQDLSFLAHELKTPLSHIFIELESLKNTNTDTNLANSIEQLLYLNKKLSVFIKDYLRIASVRAITLDSLQLSAVRLNRQLDELVKNMTLVESKRIIFNPKSDITLFIEPHHIESLLSNLISNALRYSNEQIEIITNVDSLIIVDHGALGFSAAAIQNLGRPFNRSNLAESTGLGLTYCFEICSLYKWTLTHERINHSTYMSVQFNSEISI